jgi:hypothetical protein
MLKGDWVLLRLIKAEMLKEVRNLNDKHASAIKAK